LGNHSKLTFEKINPMKKIYVSLMIAATALITSCSAPEEQSLIVGDWTLTEMTNKEGMVELTDCDSRTTWNFTTEAQEPLGDGTAVQLLVAKGPEDCEYYGFEAKWAEVNGQLFVSTSRIGGMGGSSIAGLMTIEELSANKLVVSSMGKQLTFQR
jgi:hypothetical protein